MTSVSPRGRVLLLLLAVLLVLPWSLAAEPRRTAPPRLATQEPVPAASLATSFGSWLRSLWGKAGSDIDPDGIAAVPPSGRPAGRTQTGANIDPNGVASANAVSNIDPDG